jgi:lipoyl-dependent peroxiredoxin
MALTAGLEKAGLTPSGVKTSAEVKLERQGESFTITGIALTSEAAVAGIDDGKFQTIAEETKKGCPVSKALAGMNIILKASLARQVTMPDAISSPFASWYRQESARSGIWAITT